MYARFEVFKIFLCVFMRFRTLRIMGKCTSRHLCRYVGLDARFPRFPGANDFALSCPLAG